MSAPSIIILTGAPGSGKSTVGDALATTAPHRSVHMHIDSFFDWVRGGFVSPHLPEARDQNATVLSTVAIAALGYWRGGYEVIIDGIVGPSMLPIFQSAFAQAGAPMSYIVLRANPQIGIDRLLARDRAHAEGQMEAIRSLQSAFADLGPLEPHAVDTSFINQAQAASEIRNALPGGRFLLRGRQN